MSHAIKNHIVDGSYDYKIITKNVIALVQEQKFKMLETLTQSILDEIMKNKKVRFVRVEWTSPMRYDLLHRFQSSWRLQGMNENKGMNEYIISIGSNINTEIISWLL